MSENNHSSFPTAVHLSSYDEQTLNKLYPQGLSLKNLIIIHRHGF